MNAIKPKVINFNVHLLSKKMIKRSMYIIIITIIIIIIINS